MADGSFGDTWRVRNQREGLVATVRITISRHSILVCRRGRSPKKTIDTVLLTSFKSSANKREREGRDENIYLQQGPALPELGPEALMDEVFGPPGRGRGSDSLAA